MTWRSQIKQVATVLLCVVAVGWALCLAALAAGCGPQLQQVRAQYEGEVHRCLDNEQAIVARTGSSMDQDAADLVAERARCDAALAAIRAQCGRACR